MTQELCERCKSPMQYTTTSEPSKWGEVEVDYWLCLFCGNEFCKADQIRINDARWIKLRDAKGDH